MSIFLIPINNIVAVLLKSYREYCVASEDTAALLV